jgi:hypothetical protein
MGIESLQYYVNIFFNVLMAIVLMVYFQSLHTDLTAESNLRFKKMMGVVLLCFVVLIMGLRPISFFFGDMGMYDLEFQKYQMGAPLNTDKDVLFEIFLRTSSKMMNSRSFFLVCALLYVVPLYVATRKLLKDYWFYGFLMLVASFSFWAYGVNGIRNGIATSLFILGISRTKILFTAIWFVIAIAIHKSMILPVGCFAAVMVYNNPNLFFYCWIAAIPVSLASGSFWESFFLKLGFGQEDRLAGYLGDEALDLYSQIQTGFRWDFILYSMTGVFTGWYFLVVKKFDDVFYKRLYSVYVLANIAWILIIQSNFSNRFAYLSWFLLGLVIIYPLLKNQIFSKQHQIVGNIILVYFVFTYVLNVFLAGS